MTRLIEFYTETFSCLSVSALLQPLDCTNKTNNLGRIYWDTRTTTATINSPGLAENKMVSIVDTNEVTDMNTMSYI